MKKYTVLRNGDLLEFETNDDVINELVDKGYRMDGYVNAESMVDARIKYQELTVRVNQNQPQKSDNPSSYLNVISTIFLILSLIGCVAFQVAASHIGGTYLFASSIAWLIITLLIHSACRCLIYITRKQAYKGR